MSDAVVGFWTRAETESERTAVIDPEGTEVTYGELGAEANRLVHGLRALGVPPGGGIAVVMPNSTELLALCLAALQAGWYLTPINHHLVGPEIAFIVEDSEADVVVGHERFAETCAKAAAETTLSPECCFAVGEVSGFRPLSELSKGQPPRHRTGPQVRPCTTPPARRDGPRGCAAS